MPKQTWIIASILSALTLIAITVYSTQKQSALLQRTEQAVSDAKADSEKQGAEVARRTAELADLSNRLEQAEATIKHLSEENKMAEKTQQSLEGEMRKALESKDVTISELKGKLTVNIVDRILFDSGEAELKPDGQKLLEQIAAVLSTHTNRQIHVIGHTDDVPIRRRFTSNWELSTARAIAAVRFLQEKAGVDARHLGALGYGEFHPIAPNTSAEGRAKNRRIEVVILPEELALPEPAGKIAAAE
jgi:chemotaxis protein MotB